MGFRSDLGFLFRTLARLALFAFVLTLPVTIFPIIFGIGGGVSFHLWSHRQVEEDTNALTYEVERKSNLDYWSVPGAPTIHDFLDRNGPFHIPALTTLDWVEKLCLTLPNEHCHADAAGIDKMASLEGLARKLTFGYSSCSTQYWVYVTSFPEWRNDPWDDAFSSLLQYLYANPLPPETSIFHLDCSAAAFLCGVWGVKYPSLVHLTVENGTLADREAKSKIVKQDDAQEDSTWLLDLLTSEYTYNYPDEDLLPVTARIIELPLDGEDASKILPRNVFPTPDLQLRTIMLDLVLDDIHTLWEEYSPSRQMMRRYQDYFDARCERRGTVWYYLNEIDNWYTDHFLDPIFGKEFTSGHGPMAGIQGVLFLIAGALSSVARLPFQLGWEIYSWYFGLGWDGLPLGTHTLPDEWADDAGGSAEGGNMLGDMMAGFWDSMAREIKSQESEKAGKAAVTEKADM
ncbi:hypothetical protein PMZ80_005478 [Knufia obscura]|uniref:Uncharacterized protein n=1 Tax=Knufia obscura TaxID=1635080 RepID=A0ABR0RQP2_9EURO|nr:hypothetical protein PMZ80_005478 [Knufia obscura]